MGKVTKGRVQMTLYVKASTRKRIKKAALDLDLSASELAEVAMLEYLAAGAAAERLKRRKK